MGVQNILKPIANRIVGRAIRVMPKKPRFNIVRGIVRRGFRTVPKFIHKLDTHPNIDLYKDPVVGYVVAVNNNTIGVIRKMDDIRNLPLSKSAKTGIARVIRRRVLGHYKNLYGKQKKIARGLGQALSRQKMKTYAAGVTGGLVGTGGGYLAGRKSGREKSYKRGYLKALNDVLTAEKNVRNDTFYALEKLQASGIKPIDIEKMSPIKLYKLMLNKGIKERFARRFVVRVHGVTPKGYSKLGGKAFKYGKKVFNRDDDTKKVISAMPAKMLAREDLAGRKKKRKIKKIAGAVPMTATARSMIGVPGKFIPKAKNILRQGVKYIKRKGHRLKESNVFTATPKTWIRRHPNIPWKGLAVAGTAYGIGSSRQKPFVTGREI